MSRPEARVVGRGAFTKVWEAGNTAYVASTCIAKQAISDMYEHPMIPKLEYVGCVPYKEDIKIFEAPLYEKLTNPKEQLSPRYFKYYQQITKAFRRWDGGYGSSWGYEAIVRRLDRAELTPYLRNVVMGMLTYASSYIGQMCICMEVSPRNLMAYKGRLILNDMFFDPDVVEEEGFYPYYLKQLRFSTLKESIE